MQGMIQRLPRSVRSIWLRVLSAVAMWAPSMPLRIAANRAKGVKFGTGPWIGVHAYLDVHHSHPDPANCLVFGDNVAIGNNVSIFTHDSLYNRITAGRDPIEWGHVHTGSHVNISPHSFLYNCTIGDHSIVAPGSVVANAEFPPYSLIAGNPAKVVKDLRERVVRPATDTP